jgi:predicted O-methyltransferase YrrM
MHSFRQSVLVKLYRKIRYRKGFGVHSPFVYNLITKVVEEKSAYYSFEEIENFRRKLLCDNELSRITAREIPSAAYGALLFRTVNFFQCRNVIEIGSSTGVMGLYLGMASRTRCNCRLLDERHGLAQFVRQFALAHNLNNLQYIEGDYKENISRLCAELPDTDLLFIHRLPETMTITELMNLCSPLIGKHSILIIDGIYRNKEMQKIWQTLKHDQKSRVVVDLYALGMVFFNDKLPKRYYKAYFNYGKKQNLHTNRRQRLHFISRRKKGTKNASSYRGLRHSR